MISLISPKEFSQAENLIYFHDSGLPQMIVFCWNVRIEIILLVAT